MILAEAVCCSVEDALAATGSGADRIELCVGLELGGLTPTPGLMREVREATALPVFAMLRPRAGGFLYSHPEKKTLLRDALTLLEAGADGLVVGALRVREETPLTLEVDRSFCTLLRETVGSAPLVFHRAFDQVSEPEAALETLIERGFCRVLTSGQKATALEGRAVLGSLVRQAGSRITVMAGGGIRAGNVRQLLDESRVTEIHLGPRRPASSVRPSDSVDYGNHQEFDPEQFRAVLLSLTT